MQFKNKIQKGQGRLVGTLPQQPLKIQYSKRRDGKMMIQRAKRKKNPRYGYLGKEGWKLREIT